VRSVKFEPATFQPANQRLIS